MDRKIQVLLLLMVLGIALYHVKAAGRCDWPRGTCTYIYDPCPPNWERCAQYDNDCPLATNHCCCRRRKPTIPTAPPTKEPPQACDWPRGTCTYIHDPCPPNWERCAQYDGSCKVPTNHCCCRKKKLKIVEDPVEVAAAPCDWPYGTCTYVNDPCPPNWERCPSRDPGCPVKTNHCCCRKTPTPPPGKCDWPRGTCTYVKDPCPPNWERCPDYDIDCEKKTNHCCCRKNPPVEDPAMPEKAIEVAAKPCDWRVGTCTFRGEACPPTWHRCPQYDRGCKLPTNWCCCRP